MHHCLTGYTYGCQGAGTVGVTVGRFKINGRKFQHKIPSYSEYIKEVNGELS